MAAQKMEWALNTMNAVGVFDMDLSSVDAVQKAVRSITPIAEYFPGGVIGCDKNGNIINMHTMGQIRIRSLVDAERASKFFIGAIVDCEGAAHLMRLFNFILIRPVHPQCFAL
ncbi:unnamed protein product [Anisakis simplex]|uniref:CBS domain-containing protein n=1 Tax=Anisakis simplex TaxID=6269 RepID=A0A0M3JEN2_ANISI|nr:unnamed protein product [Anisakis simplex]